MTVGMDVTSVLIILNIAATVGGFLRVAVIVERRLTRVETLIEQHEKHIYSVSRKGASL